MPQEGIRSGMKCPYRTVPKDIVDSREAILRRRYHGSDSDDPAVIPSHHGEDRQSGYRAALLRRRRATRRLMPSAPTEMARSTPPARPAGYERSHVAILLR